MRESGIMKIGCCTGIEIREDGCTFIQDVEVLKNAGFDYLELPAISLSELKREQLEQIKFQSNALNIPVEVANCAYLGSTKLTGDDVNFEEINEYLEKMFKHIAFLGVKVLVFGSGGSRRIPEGFDVHKAELQIAQTLTMMGDIAKIHNINVVIEPLNKKETNVINDLTKGCDMVKLVNHSNVHLLCDYYHMAVEKEPISNITDTKNSNISLKHIHIANPIGRVFPTEQEDYMDFFKALKEINYNDRISVEGKACDISIDGKISCDFLKKCVQDIEEVVA